MSPLDKSTVTGGILWTMYRDVMWKWGADKTMYLANVYTYHLFLHVSAMVPTISILHTVERKHWQSKTRKVRPCTSARRYIKGICVKYPNSQLLTPVWLKLIHGIRFTTFGEFQLVLSSPLPSLNLWRKKILLTVRKWGKAKSLLESWSEKSYI